jgi:hypothetical protein
MPALSADFIVMLKRELATRYVPLLSPLLHNGRPPEEQAAKQLSRSLSAFALRHYLDVAPKLAASAVIDDFDDNGIDAIHYHEATETLYLVQAKMRAAEQFSQEDAQAFAQGCRLLLRQELDTFNEHFQKRRVEIEDALGACSHIRLLIAYCGAGVSQHAQANLDQLIGDETLDEERLRAPVEFFSPEEISASLRGLHAYQRVNTKLTLEHYGKVEEPRKTYFGVVHLKDLVDLHQDRGKALYEQNIRYFLGGRKSDVNRSIQKTLRDDPTSFFYLNNGVTALCDEISPKDGTREKKNFRLLGLSIINGAQTVASAAELLKSPNPPDISKAKVLLTLIQANAAGNFAPEVTRARNHQNPVSTANFAALDPQQERLRQELACFGIQYHYRPEAAAVPDQHNIMLSEALTALAWLEPDSRYPVWFKTSVTNISDASSPHYQAIFNDGLPGVRLINAVYYSRHIHRLLKVADLGSHGTERLVYRHGMHAIGQVLHKRLRQRIEAAEPVDPNNVGPLLSQPFDVLRQQAADLFRETVIGHGPLAHFKSQEYTVPYLRRLMAMNYGLTDHSAVTALDVYHHGDPFPRAGLFKFLTQQAPQI